ncbi:kinase-interacting 1-like [Octopus vulgaris]|uniref:Kinase-interacting 1-like n=1 Tax=Octopus vulgaris TaxID=6645 RepID=A0AA36BML1_OCTVU|nr:kinase-interacting 1-like [Octopus vulgaris]
MLKIQRVPCPDITFRIAHDISLDSFPDDDTDAEFDFNPKELEFYSLTQNKEKERKYDVTEKTVVPSFQEKSDVEEFTGKDVGNYGSTKTNTTYDKPIYKASDSEMVLRKNEINKQLHSNSDKGNDNGLTNTKSRMGTSNTTNTTANTFTNNTVTKNTYNNNTTAANTNGAITTMDSNRYLQSVLPAKTVNNVNHKEWPQNTSGISNEPKTPRRPRKLPETPKTRSKFSCYLDPPVNTAPREKSLAEELLEATRQKLPLLRDIEVDNDDDNESCNSGDVEVDDDDDVFLPPTQNGAKYKEKSQENLFDRLLYFNIASRNTKAYIHCDNPYIKEDSFPAEKNGSRSANGGARVCRATSDSEESKRKSSSSSTVCPNYQELEVTHRGMHRFIPRHSDEIDIEIGDPIHVKSEDDDLWCQGVNLRTGKKGIFPSMYATDLHFLEEDDDDSCKKFQVKFLGSLEVNCHKGTEVLCQAINKVALTRRKTLSSTPPPNCCLEISDYGIRMIDKSKSVHESDANFSNFFALKNISYCGYHPRNENYFAFITKHPREYRFACHVFLGDHSTRSISEALGLAFKRFSREYMAFTHPTEDIYLE